MRRHLLRAALLLVLTAPGAAAQVADTVPTQRRPVPADTFVAREGPTPAGAFLRSLLVPGWGQGAVDSYWRGGIYFGGHVGNVFALLKTRAKLEEVRSREDRREAFVRDSILEEDPDTPEEDIADALEADPILEHAAGLRSTRGQQQEDWLVWSAFWVLANAVDAYVAAQLADFPGDLIVRPATAGTLELGVALPMGRR